MIEKSCSGCGGKGTYWTTEKVPNPAGGMYLEVSVEKTCLQCGGSGTVRVSERGGGGGGSGGGGGTSSPLGDYLRKCMDRIPVAVRRIAMGLAFVPAFAYALFTGHGWLESAFWGVAAMAALVLGLVLVVVGYQIALAAVYLALIGGVIWGAYWLYSKVG